jgi:hypothetical protein
MAKLAWTIISYAPGLTYPRIGVGESINTVWQLIQSDGFTSAESFAELRRAEGDTRSYASVQDRTRFNWTARSQRLGRENLQRTYSLLGGDRRQVGDNTITI